MSVTYILKGDIQLESVTHFLNEPPCSNYNKVQITIKYFSQYINIDA